MSKIGAHVSAAVSLELAFTKAQQIGAECMQFFVSPPQQWAFTHHNEEEIKRFRDEAGKSGIGPNFIHGTYLVNLGTEKPEHLQKSIDWLKYGMGIAEKLGIEGVIFHTGSHKGKGFDEVLPQVVGAIKQVLAHDLGDSSLPHPNPLLTAIAEVQGEGTVSEGKKPNLILETSAGGGGSIGRNFAELGAIIREIGEMGKRVKVCIDVAHTFAAGYDWRTNIDAILEEFDREVGLDKLAAFHANDSKVDFESYKDRHANIGEGFLGKEAFAQLLNHPKLKDKPFLLEVPGFDDNGPDKENIDILKDLRNKQIYK